MTRLTAFPHNYPPFIPIANSEIVFPVSRVFGIGRNYSKFPENEVKDPECAVLFMKDPYMLSLAAEGVEYPEDSKQLRYEIELVVAISKSAKKVSVEEANEYIFGYAVGIDFTKYDVQKQAKDKGHPWDKGKSFRGCAPISPIVCKEKVELNDNKIFLKVNDNLVPEGSLSQMIYNPKEIISLISSKFELKAGDLIFTGTPQGVGMAQKGDQMFGSVGGVCEFSLGIN